MIINTNELVGYALDWAVAQVTGHTVSITDSHRIVILDAHGHVGGMWHPSTSWAQCGPMISTLQIALTPEAHDGREGVEMSERWWANVYYDGGNEYTVDHCDTALIAACRAIVGTKFGDSVDVPEVLV